MARAKSPPRPPAARAPSRAVGDVPRAASVALAVAAFALYLAQTPPVSGDKDTAEFTLVLALNGVAHPTGYPLFTLLGHAWTALVHALGAPWAFAANSWSALGGALAVWFMHRLALALTAPAPGLGRSARALVAALPVAFFAVDPLWTYETTLAEVYAWHVAWALGAGLAWAWLAPRVGLGEDGRPAPLRRHAALWGLICGLGAAHHATSVLVAAPLSLGLLGLLAARRRLSAGLVAIALGAALVPLASYLLILERAAHPGPATWAVLAPGWRGLWFHMTGGEYAGLVGGFAPSPEQAHFLRAWLWPVLVPALALSAVAAVRARGAAARARVWGLLAAALAGLGFAFRYAVPDPSSYFLQPLAFALVAPVGLLAEGLAAGAPVRRAARAAGLALGALALALAVPWTRVGLDRARLFVEFDRRLASMWDAIPFERGFVFWSDDMWHKLRERQLLLHDKPDLEVLDVPFLCNAPLRERFAVRHGFDPVGDLPADLVRRLTGPAPGAPGDSVIAAVEERVNERSPLPVVHFDPRRSSVRLLRKHAPAPADSAGPRR